jgi:hypothetical protein
LTRMTKLCKTPVFFGDHKIRGRLPTTHCSIA